MRFPRIVILLGCLAAGLGSLPVQAADECINCHQDPIFKVQHPKLFNYFKDFENSVHGVAGLTCTDCHGGDATTTDTERAHAGVLDPVAYEKIPETCGQCHAEEHDNFVTSKHYKLLEDNGTAPNCVTCHGAMEMDFIFVTRVKNTCAFCHNLETGTAPDVPDRADYILNKINIMKGYRSFVNTYANNQVEAHALDQSYSDLIGRWHRFDLGTVEADTKELMGEYRQAKAQAMRDRREH